MLKINGVEILKEKDIQLFANIGRNDLCPCGSTKKYKKCCLPKHEAAQALQRQMEEPKTLSDQHFTVQEYIDEVGYPIRNYDFFLLELLSIIGSMLYNNGKLKSKQITEILKKVMGDARKFYLNCQQCEFGCLKEPMKKISFQSLIEKGLKLEEFPPSLQKPVSINFFYFEFINMCVIALQEEIKMLLDEETRSEIVDSIHASIFDYIAENCWEECDNKCIAKHKENAYCSFCTFGKKRLKCPKDDEISYEEIGATEKDMIH